MNVTLKPEYEAFIRDQIDQGRFDDASQVIEEAIRHFEDHQKVLYLRAAVAEAREQIARGEYEEWSPELMARLQEEADEEDRLGLPIDPDVAP